MLSAPHNAHLLTCEFSIQRLLIVMSLSLSLVRRQILLLLVPYLCLNLLALVWIQPLAKVSAIVLVRLLNLRLR